MKASELMTILITACAENNRDVEIEFSLATENNIIDLKFICSRTLHSGLDLDFVFDSTKLHQESQLLIKRFFTDLKNKQMEFPSLGAA